MGNATLDTDIHKNLILLLYSETFPYTSHPPYGITVSVFSKICKKLDIELVWRQKYWNKQHISTDRIIIFLSAKEKRNVRLFTQRLRNSFAHCLITVSNGIVNAKCKAYWDGRKASGPTIFELHIEENKLIDLLEYIHKTKQ
ncbi:MAG: hypothetical protein HDS42_01700 [Bacteroides sp.]|nr:hypothetical protein [Bacteroides sp.]